MPELWSFRVLIGGIYSAIAGPPTILAQAEIGLPLWGQIGIAAVFILAFVTLQIVPGALYKRLQEELKEERAYRQQLEEKIKADILPLMFKYVDATEQMVEFLRDNYRPKPPPRAKK